MKNLLYKTISSVLFILILAVSCDTSGMQKIKNLFSSEKEKKQTELLKKLRKETKHMQLDEATDAIAMKEAEQEIGLGEGKATPYNVLLAIANNTKPPFQTPAIVEVRDTQNTLVSVIQPQKEKTELVTLEGISNSLSVFSAQFYNDNRKLALILTVFRNQNQDMQYLIVNLKNINEDAPFEKTIVYDDTGNNYLIKVNLDRSISLYNTYRDMLKEENPKLKQLLKDIIEKKAQNYEGFGFAGSTLDVQPGPETLINELREKKEREKKLMEENKKGSLIRRMSSMRFSRSTPAEALPATIPPTAIEKEQELKEQTSQQPQ